MGNKFLCILTLCLCGAMLSGVPYRNTTARRKNQKAKTEATAKKTQESSQKTNKTNESAEKKSDRKPKKFDPKKPVLTEEDVQSMMEGQLRNKIVNSEPPKHLKDVKKEENNLINAFLFSSIQLSFERFANNPELPEVTHFKPDWYKKMAKQLAELKPSVQKMDNARFLQDEKMFREGREEYLQNVKLIEHTLTKEKPAKLSPEAWKKIHLANVQMRTKQYNQYLKAKAAAEAAEAKEKAKQRAQQTKGK